MTLVDDILTIIRDNREKHGTEHAAQAATALFAASAAELHLIYGPRFMADLCDAMSQAFTGAVLGQPLTVERKRP